MVKQLGGDIYICPYCNSQHDNYYDADECADDCHTNMREQIIQKTEPVRYMCEYCNNSYTLQFDAEDCEAKHIATEDQHYEKYTLEHDYEALYKAANHPGQYKLVSFTKQKNGKI